MKTKKPKLIESVGALYYAFNTPKEETNEFDITTYEDVIRSPVIKTISVDPESETTVVRASGEDYDEVSQTSSIGLEIEAVGFDPADRAKARGEVMEENGLIIGGASNPRPYIAIGVPVLKVGGGKQLKWYPKCKLVEDNEEVSTSEDSFSEQNPTLNFNAYAFNDHGDKFAYLDTETENYPKEMTEEKFFSKVISSKEDVNSIISPGA